MRFGVAGWWSVLVVAVACGGSTTGGTPDGGSGGSGGSGGGAGGSSGATLCNQGCDKLGFAKCPVPYDVAGCKQACNESYSELPECAAELDAVAQCVIVKGVITCDESGEASYETAQVVCDAQFDALVACANVPGSGGAGGVGGVGGSSGSGGSPNVVQCGQTACESWKLGGLFDLKACCPGAPNECGALSDSTIEQITSVPQGCHGLDQPGNLDCGCPLHEFDNPLDPSTKAQFPGCCRSNGECGVWVDLTSAEGPLLGCIDADFSHPPQACQPGLPSPCDGG